MSATIVVHGPDGNPLPPPPPEPSRPQQWLEIAANDRLLADALTYFGHGKNWFDTYKAFESIEYKYGGPKKFLKLGWADEDVPHRSDDVVRSNTELRGPVTAIDTSYWSESELEQIAYRGFRELNADIAPPIIQRLTRESFGSPQLTQAIGLKFLFREQSTGFDGTAGADRGELCCNRKGT
jgi:hypothetical protein